MTSIEELSPSALEERLLGAVGAGSYPSIPAALEFAKESHSDQARKDGSPYIGHPLRVALRLLETGGLKGPDLLCAALLHDVVEDCGVELAQVRELFGKKTADLVRAMTLPELREGQSKSERDQAHFSSLSWESRDAQILRSADRLDNVLTMGSVFPEERRAEYLEDTESGLVPLILACNTALYHALQDAVANAKSGA